MEFSAPMPKAPVRTWKIRDQQPDGSWGPEREVTLNQFKAEHAAKCERAEQVRS